MELLMFFVKVLLFPGVLFLLVCATLTEFEDRKFYARMQNRRGPKWYIPIADFFKLIGKQSIIPRDANVRMVSIMPVASLAATVTAFIYVPVCGTDATFAFEGDIIIILYLLTFPALTQFLAGWYSRSLYATIGATRVVTQMFAYEVPLFMALLAPSLFAGTWSVSGISAYYSLHPVYSLINIPAFIVALVCVQCKLAGAPFDAPEAETEIVGGPFVEYGGRLLAFFRLSTDCERVVAASLVAAVFMPVLFENFALNLLFYFVKVFVIIFLLSLIRVIMARLRVSQTMSLCWKIITPIALVQTIVNLLIRGYLA